jgi:predicted aconitase
VAVPLSLSLSDQSMLDGEQGEAAGMAMRLIVEMAGVAKADRLIDISSAHIDSCLYHGKAGLDWAERLAGGGAQVSVPTTLNVSSLDLLHPHLYRGSAETAAAARRLMDCYVAMGCEPTWTCAPYQLPHRPNLGQQIAWAESNAIVFANSVLGARTERYGDFIDICAAITGRVPDTGLHTDDGRRGQVLFDVRGLPPSLLEADVAYPVLGHLIGADAGTMIPVIDGLPVNTSEDRLKAIGAAGASSGSVALFHAVGVTPEAHTLDDAFGGDTPKRTVTVTKELMTSARDSLSTTNVGALTCVSLGTPHYSASEFGALVELLTDVRVHPSIEFYVSTNRFVLESIEPKKWDEVLRAAGVQLVVDTCTYITPILRKTDGIVMTDSAKWAYYAPGNLGVEVCFGSTRECVQSAARGRIWRDEELWSV